MKNTNENNTALEILLTEYKKELKKYLDTNTFFINDEARVEQYKKCLTIANCCKLIGMTEETEKNIVSAVRFELYYGE
jgi:hypothetical protein